jgi:small subunit ribosomal protein S6
MARSYELTLVISSQVSEDATQEAVQRYQEFLTGQGATVVNVDQLGVRKLAYEIARQQQGFYTFIQFESETDVIPELDRICKLDESLLRHLVVVVEEGFEPEPAEGEEADVSGDAGETAGEAEDSAPEDDETGEEDKGEPDEGEEEE